MTSVLLYGLLAWATGDREAPGPDLTITTWVTDPGDGLPRDEGGGVNLRPWWCWLSRRVSRPKDPGLSAVHMKNR